jgi:chromosome segregation ATPase
MISDELGGGLHGRASQGETLSPLEMEQLEAWYAQKDEQEARLLKMLVIDVDCVALQGQINRTLEKISAVSQDIRKVSAENSVLRQEISELQQQLNVPESA